VAASGGSDVDAMSRWECAVGVEREVGKDLERRSRREWLKLAKAAAATAQGKSALGEAYIHSVHPTYVAAVKETARQKN